MINYKKFINYLSLVLLDAGSEKTTVRSHASFEPCACCKVYGTALVIIGIVLNPIAGFLFNYFGPLICSWSVFVFFPLPFYGYLATNHLGMIADDF